MSKPIVVPFYERKPYLADVYKVRKVRRVVTVSDISRYKDPSDPMYSYTESIAFGNYRDKNTGHIWYGPYLEIKRYPNISQDVISQVLQILDSNQDPS